MNHQIKNQIDHLLFFGSFDPPHNNHIAIIEFALKVIAPKQMKIILLNKHTEGKHLSDSNHRLAMLKMLCSNFNSNVSICTNDIRYNLSGKTIESLRIYKKRFPNQKIGILLGSDQYTGFKKWHDSSEILKLATCFFILRPGYDKFDDTETDNIIFLENTISTDPTISSLKIKYLLEIGDYKTAKSMTLPCIFQYLTKYNLYKNFFTSNPELRSYYAN